jgi:hypothetical protein
VRKNRENFTLFISTKAGAGISVTVSSLSCTVLVLVRTRAVAEGTIIDSAHKQSPTTSKGKYSNKNASFLIP